MNNNSNNNKKQDDLSLECTVKTCVCNVATAMHRGWAMFGYTGTALQHPHSLLLLY